MKYILFSLLPLLLNACSQNAEPPIAADKLCEDPRPEICTMEYAPVCGIIGDEMKEYSNGCAACSDPQVSGYLEQACELE